MVLTVSFSALTFPLQARVQLDLVAKFQNEGIELDVVTVMDSEAEPSGKVALLGIATPLRSSFSFKREEWLLLIDLWSKAVKVQSEFLENHWLDEGDGNIRRLSSYHKCRARDQVRHQFPPERARYVHPFEG